MEGRGGIRKQVVGCRKCRKGKSVSYDGNAAKELVVSGSIFKEDGVLSSPPLQLPSPCLLTTVHTHIQMHVHVERHTYTTPALRHYPSSSWNSRSMKWSSLLPLLSHSLSLSLPLSFSISRFHSVFVAHTLSVTVSAHSPSRYFRKIKGDKGER